MMSRNTCAFCLVLLISPVWCLAGPTEQDIEEAKRVQTLAEAAKATAQARQATAEAEAAEAKAKLGTLDLSKLSAPEADAKTLNLEAKLLAYGAVAALAKDIANDVTGAVGQSKVVIYTDREFTLIEQYGSFGKNLRALANDVKNVTTPKLDSENAACVAAAPADLEAGGGIGGLGPLGSIDVVAQVLSLFKSNKKLEGTEVTVDAFALSAAVAAELQNKGAKAYYLPLLLSSNALALESGPSSTEKAFDELTQGLTKLDTTLAEVTAKRAIVTQQKTAKKKPSASCAVAYAKDEKLLADVAARGQLLKDRAAKFVAAAMTPDEKTGVTLMQSLVAVDIIRKNVTDAFLLQLKPISAGGTTLTKTNFFRASFQFSGGAVVSYMLVNSKGAFVKGGLAGKYGGFADPDSLPAALDAIGHNMSSPTR